ncbi:uncharacterized protein synpo2a isoform X2 [Genypterus blacodes]|uniref:uncharacterized protein synpo2a isoform X2 n=1 Tax=Genypterus blacodes TaxID=154954 RepID=UPI003F76565D
MGTGDYMCVTLQGGAPWGFTLQEGEVDTYIPLHVIQVEEGSSAFVAGLQDGDEVVLLNGEPCADLTLTEALALIDASADCLQLLVKRYCSITPGDFETELPCCGDGASSSKPLESTTLHILSTNQRSQIPRELYIAKSQDGAYYREVGSETAFPMGPRLLDTQTQDPSFVDSQGMECAYKEKDEGLERCFSPGDTVKLQVSLSEQTLEDTLGCSSLGSALGIDGALSNREVTETIHTATYSHYVPSSVREPLGQHGVVLRSPSMLGQVEVILQQSSASGAGRSILTVGGPGASVGSQEEGEEGGGHSEGVPQSFTVSFGIPSEEGTAADEQEYDSEGDPDKPNKHRARHSRLRRSESLSEKQVKEAKSKCKRIALLLTAAPPNPNNKGVLMFKKHRQRAKKYTLVSYGTGETEPESSDEEDEDNRADKEGIHTVEFTLVAPSGSDLDEHFLANAQSGKSVLTINWDKGLLEIEQKLNNQAEMECLPETKGKGASMFAQRRMRMDEISAEHDELRRQGIPVEGVQEAEKKTAEHSYMQATTEGQAYMDVNIHQQSQHQQYQQYQEQQYYEQQQQYQQQQYQQQYQQQQQQQQYEQQHYQQQQQMYQQQQEYQQEQQHIQQYSSNINGITHHQTNEMQSSLSNRTAKPFSVQGMAPASYSPAMSGTNQESMGQGEQIASRDERIATPAIKTGLLQDARKRNTAKPMFTFKDAPKVSPNPMLLNLLNRSNRKIGFESEEDYLSLGAEACNFLQSPGVKNKTPPPVAPKPAINLNSPPWSAPTEVTNQNMPQQAENSVSTPAIAPTEEITPAPELEPIPAPAPQPSPSPTPQEAPASAPAEEQQTWTPPEPQPAQQSLQVTAEEENSDMNSGLQAEHAPVSSQATAQVQMQQQPAANTWNPPQVQPQEPAPNQPSQQLPWVTPTQPQAQPQPSVNSWNPQVQRSQSQEQTQAQTHVQTSWAQSQEQTQAQTHVQTSWAQSQAQAQSQLQVQPSWAHSHEQPQLQQVQPNWSQPQEPVQQQPQPTWAQPSQRDSPHQPTWGQHPQQKSEIQPPWVQQVQPEAQQQQHWVQQPQHQAPQEVWPQAQVQAQAQPQPPWVSPAQAQQQHPSVNAWPPSQPQPWMQPAQKQAPLNPWAPVPAQVQSQPSWAHHPSEHTQNPINSWGPEQNQAQAQPPWAQPVPPQPTPQPSWQQPPPNQHTSPQPQMNAWPPAQAQPQPQTPMTAWAPQSQQTPMTVSAPVMNTRETRPSPRPWQTPPNAPQNRTPPPPPQRMSSYNIGQRVSSPINPMATVLNPSPSSGSAFEMPTVKGKGADMFAKRQSRMEKYVVDSQTVEANKASRSTSPTASLPNEWKYTPNALGRSYSLSPPTRVPSGQKSASTYYPRPPSRASTTPPGRQTSWLDRGRKPLSPWEAASRHPLGLVDEAFAFQNLKQTLISNVCSAAQRKMLPEPPAEWKARVSYQAPQKTASQTWSLGQSRSQSRAPLPSFLSPTKCIVSPPAGSAGYRSLPRQWQPRRCMTETNLGHSRSSSESNRPFGKPSYKAVNTSSTTWSWKR